MQQKGPDRQEQKNSKERFVRHNWKIKAARCRVIEENAAPVIMDTREAIEYAQSKGLDLVEVGYDFHTGISTAKICDYGKYQYDLKQKEKLAKKQARANTVDVKCLQMSLTTDTADLNRIIAHAKEFLEKGDKVKLSLRFRGRRELANIGLGRDMMKQVLSNFDGLAVLDSQPTLNGKELSCVLRKATLAAQAPQKKFDAGRITISVN
jgi:translation initiation factor IF-3